MSDFRPTYKALTPGQQSQMDDIKNIASQLDAYLQDGGASRELALARTKLEECVMWAVKGVTT